MYFPCRSLQTKKFVLRYFQAAFIVQHEHLKALAYKKDSRNFLPCLRFAMNLYIFGRKIMRHEAVHIILCIFRHAIQNRCKEY